MDFRRALTRLLLAFTLTGNALAERPAMEHGRPDTVRPRQNDGPPPLGKTLGKESPKGCVYTPDGKRLLSVDSSALSAWEVPSGKAAYHHDLEAVAAPRRRGNHGTVLGGIRLSPDGERALLVTWRPEAHSRIPVSLYRYFDVADGKPRPSVLPERPLIEQPTSFGFGADGQPLLHYGDLNTGKRSVYAFQDGRPLDEGPAAAKFVEDSTGNGAALERSPDGRWLARQLGNRISLLEVVTGRTRSFALPSGQAIPIASFAFSPDQRYVAADDDSGRLVVFEVETGQVVRVLPYPHGGLGGSNLSFSPDGRFLSWTDGSGIARVVPWASGTAMLPALPRFVASGVRGCLAIAPDGKTIAVGNDRGVQLYQGGPVLPPPPPAQGLSPKAMQALHDRLSGDAIAALDAVTALTSEGSAAVKLLAKHLPEEGYRPADPDLLKKLIADLGHGRYAFREKANAELAKLGRLEIEAEGHQSVGSVRSALEAALGNPSPEVAQRANLLLQAIRNGTPAPTTLSTLRVIEVLERIGTTEAREQLARLVSATYPQGYVARGAASALARLAAR